MKFWHRVKTYHILQVHDKETDLTTNIGIFKTYEKAEEFDNELRFIGAYPESDYVHTIQEIPFNPSHKLFSLFWSII